MIEIRKIEETKCELYDPNDNLIGVIDNFLTLNDVRIQIKRKGLKNYYIKWNEVIMEIDENGYIDGFCYPGFFDNVDKQLDELIEW